MRRSTKAKLKFLAFLTLLGFILGGIGAGTGYVALAIVGGMLIFLVILGIIVWIGVVVWKHVKPSFGEDEEP